MLFFRKQFYFSVLSLLFLYASLHVSAQSVRINEVISSNASIIADEDGDFSDWVELYNSGASPVNLTGYGLTDNASQPFKWTFPDVTIQPGEYLLVWASGKNRKPVPGEWNNGLMREVFTNIGGTSISNLTNHASYPDNPTSRNLVKQYFEAPRDIADNYGQRIHGFIKPPVTGNYTFWISSDDSGHLYLSTDDNPANVVMIAEVNGWTNSREWGKYPSQVSVSIPLQAEQYYYIAALMKEGTGGDNLAVRWRLPSGTMEEPIPGERLFWNGEGELHTNFSISADGEAILLTHPDGTLVDMVDAVAIPSNLSYGRQPDGNGSWHYFNQPTPGATNSTATGYEALLDAPLISHPGGFYSSAFSINITADPEAIILYTLDGSEPDEANLGGTTYSYKNQYPHNPGNPFGTLLINAPINTYTYTEPIQITDRSAQPNRIAGRSSTYDQSPWYAPTSPIYKGTVVRAKAFKEGHMPSETATQTYFISPLAQTRYTLPVISLTMPENLLFGYEEGIYTAGKAFDDWRTQNPGGEANGGVPANYQFGGDEYEYQGHIQIFHPQEGAIIDQRMGMRIHGGYSRSFPIKSLRLYARGEYGKSYFEYPIFAERSSTEYKRIMLRNSGNDWDHTYFRDAATQAIASPLKIDRQAYRPAVVFFNGEYWGLHNMRERFDKHYFNRMYGVDAENLDILEANAIVDEGDPNHYNATISYIQANGLVQDEHYEYIKTRIDVENYIDYQIMQIFARNTDWPGNNIKFWRLKTNEYQPNAPQGHDGRWRWMLYDTDFGFGLWDNTYTHNTLAFAAQPNGPGWPNPPWSTFLFREFLKNEKFKIAFINRFDDLLNTAFRPERTTTIINEMKQAYIPEMAEHIARWKVPQNMNTWNNRVDVMIDFAQKRPAHQRQHLRSFFVLGNDINLTVDVSNPQHGHVRVNTIEVKGSTPGINENPYPFTGVYSRGIPVELEAIPAPGYQFAGWTGIANNNTAKIQVTPQGNISLVAHFVEGESTQLIHYWNFNNSTDVNTLLAVTSSIVGTPTIEHEVGAGGSSEIQITSNTTGQGFEITNPNARNGDAAGAHLRLNNPFNGTASATLIFSLPTIGYKDVVFKYGTRRSGSGAGTQLIEYSTDGNTFTSFGTFSPADGNPTVATFDFSSITAVNDNSNFKIRITFEQGSGGVVGNNRFDNVTVDATPLSGTNVPPIIAQPVGLITLIEEGTNHVVDLNTVFTDINDDPLTFTAIEDVSGFAGFSLTDNTLTIFALKRGDAAITITADDGHATPVSHTFRVLVYPKAFVLQDNDFTFSAWDSEYPERTYPEHILFLQSDVDDPNLNYPLLFPYYVAHDDYHIDDAATIGFPYKSTGRSRLNGLGEDGISFINTGRGRDLGGLLLAINTEGLDAVHADWLCQTLLQNSRIYGINLQYRVGTQGNFSNIPDAGAAYVSGSDGHIRSFTDVQLPAALVGHTYVQLLWRYHHISVTSGPRAQLRLDNITIAGKQTVVSIDGPIEAEGRSIYPNPVSERAIVQLTLARESNVKITLTDMMGRTQFLVANELMEQGKHERTFDTSALSAGSYIVTIQTHAGVTHHKVVK
ncbi:MAG: CotH kinase family protein [Cyclobacteriaceae bacterium]|nr:CotH kinase family protein [Cyclobacteriaceae bacterium]